ncbi:MAG: hypothetical protein ACJ74G_09290, partial [Blastocatellia bacterium]
MSDTRNTEKLANGDRVAKLIEEIQALTLEDRSRILEGLRENPTVIFNDWTEPNLESPCLIVMYPEGDWESIDILASVRKNAASIGHPAILLAIKRWEQVVLTQYPLSRKKTSNAIMKAARGDFKAAAKKHLENISKALLEAAQDPERRNSKLTMFRMLSLRIDEAADTYLKLVWEMLGEDDVHYKSYGCDEDGKPVKKERGYEDKLHVLKLKVATRFAEYHFGKERLNPAPLDGYALEPREVKESYLDSIIEWFNPIFDFLREEENKRFIDKPPAWEVMRNVYIKWLTGRSVKTAKNYRSETKKQS